MFSVFFTQFKMYFIAAAMVAVLGLIGGAFFYGQHIEHLSNQVALDKQRVEFQVKIDDEVKRREEISTRFETKLDNIKIVNTTITKNITKELAKPVYTDCKVPDTGVQLINDNAKSLNDVRKGITK
jgi:hypothetical protein